ncbi:FAD-dependent monooxygenase [Nocardia abscessus]|uniref:FAD-dependent monooxygenase n=1 Tax=Nocardia abscessus TaxID=120957 RepID=UPI002458B8CF|nr:FAD-dependent monooxygenase [Nocardia abscessus]
MQHTLRTSVLVAGAGPVGAVLGLELARLGIASTVIERRETIAPNPKCITTNARTMEFLRRLGLADAIRAAGLPDDHPTDVVYMTTLAGYELTRYVMPSRDELGDPEVQAIDAGWPTPEPQHRVSQLFAEPILYDALRESSAVDFRENTELVAFEQSHDGVRCVVRDADGQEQVIEADFLVGADGANSLVRKGIGARLTGIPEVARVVTVFVRAPRITELAAKARLGFMYRFVGGEAPISMAAIDGENRWICHIVLPPGTDDASFDHERAMFAAIGEEFEYELLNREVWIGRAMVSDRFRDGRVFLAGDAAHIWIPMGGFGMNAGIADSVGLAWMLRGALEGWLCEDALEAYAVERASIGTIVASHAAKITRDLQAIEIPASLGEATEEAAALREDIGNRIRTVNLAEFNSVGLQLGYAYADSPVICYDGATHPAVALDHYEESSRPGVRAPHVWLSDGSSLYDKLGDGYTLLRLGADAPAVADFESEAAARRVPLTTLHLVEPEAVAKYGEALVLVRPDQHVAWRSSSSPSAAEAAEAWDRLTGVSVRRDRVPTLTAEEVGSGFLFGEGPRWRDGRLVFSDMTGGRVLQYDPADGEITGLHEVPTMPNGLGFLPDGRLVVASMFDSVVYVEGSEGLEPYVDLSHLTTGYLGDLTVDRLGRVYVDDTGARVLEGEPPAAGRLILVDTDLSSRAVLEGLLFPNGLALSADGEVLHLVESFGFRLLTVPVHEDGGLGRPEVFADLSPGTGDGIALDPNGNIWVCSPILADVVTCYDRTGRVSARVVMPEGGEPVACAFGREDGRDVLYIVGTDKLPEGVDHFAAMAAKQTVGRLWRADITAATITSAATGELS